MKNLRAIEFWAQHVIDKHTYDDKDFIGALENEPPLLASSVMERGCNLQCSHCIYQVEQTSIEISNKIKLADVIKNAVAQMPNGSSFLHCGRTIRPWHIKTLSEIRKERKNEIALGLIDNGTFVKYMDEFKEAQLKLDWIDVSIDGDETAHNKQRNNPQAYSIARKGIREARKVANTVTSLMTTTKLNYHTVGSVVEDLLITGEIDELHVTPASPYREVNFPLIIGLEETRTIFKQLIETPKNVHDKLFYRIYRIEDLDLLAEVVGYNKIKAALEDSLIDHGRIIFKIEGIEVSYFPLSLWVQEELLIDADGAYRVAGSGQYTIAQYNKGDENISKYTVEQLTEDSNITESYNNAVRHWWKYFGKDHLGHEIRVIDKILGQG